MSDQFDPNIPKNDDTVYDAYFSFTKNMEAVNNVVGVDHFSGTAPQNRGFHKAVTFAEPLNTIPQMQGNMSILYTSTESADPKVNYPVLKFTNRSGTWEIPFGAASGGGGPSPQPDYGYKQSFEPGRNPGLFEGMGYVVFPNKFAVVWARGYLPPLANHAKAVPVPLKQIFIANVFTTYLDSAGSQGNFGQTMRDKDNKWLDWAISSTQINVFNKYQTYHLKYQALILGEGV